MLALDIGTSSVKALLFDPARCRWWSAREGCRAHFEAGVVEVPAAEWWRATRAATKEVLTTAGLPATAVGHVALTGNMSSVVLLDQKGRPVRNAILLADSRGEAELAAMPSRLRRRIADLSGNPVGPNFTLLKLLWLAANERDNMSTATVWLAAKDFVRSRLTGTVGTDPSDAFNSLLIDPATLDWRRDLIAAAGLDQRKFPVVRPGTEVAGSVSARAATATGLVAGTPVLTGLGDMAALANSVGEADGPVAAVSLGTSTTLLLPSAEGARPAPGFSAHPILPGSPWFVLASLLTGGLALDWLRRLGPIAVTPAHRARSLVFLPQLSGRGSPCFDSCWRGTVLGLDPSIGLGEMTLSAVRSHCVRTADLYRGSRDQAHPAPCCDGRRVGHYGMGPSRRGCAASPRERAADPGGQRVRRRLTGVRLPSRPPTCQHGHAGRGS